MTIDDVKAYYGTSYRFQKITGMQASNFCHWEKMGYLPIITQIKIEKMTGGALKASLEHLDNMVK